ncbi:hypothetical protein AB1K70_11460 [Bremerella sp. JC770]|uniref:BatD family protein n=1 Tax=Bremerella sp. JC770 TaxID=3232137 RepID=UPI003457F4B9
MSQRQRSILCWVVVLLTLVAISKPGLGQDYQKVESMSRQPKGWIGQRIPFFVDLRGPGPFVGAASFSIPQIPRVVIIKVGNPVVSSEEDDDQTIFTQTHEFALFSQAAGKVELPGFEVRYANKQGYTGPEVSTTGQVPALQFEIEKPEGLPDGTFVVTTPQLDVTETWDTKPTDANVGDVFHRTITQTAEQMTGMALAPPPTNVPEGIRIYPANPEVTDKTDRGELSGKRVDTITYSIRQSGTLTIPAIQYIWWDPEKKQFGSKTLPAVTFQVAAPPAVDTTPQETSRALAWTMAVFVLLALLAGLIHWQRQPLLDWLQRVKQRLNPPDKVAARQLHRACRQNDARLAETAWADWINTQPADQELPESLKTAVTELLAVRYGTHPGNAWDGQRLDAEFQRFLKSKQHAHAVDKSALPTLNVC